MSTLWHYTTRIHLAKILKSGHLRTTPRGPRPGEVPAVWFTTSDEWEPTCAKRMLVRDRTTGEFTHLGITSFEELLRSMGIARVGVEDEDGPDYLTFSQYAVLCSPEYASHLVNAAVSMAHEINWQGKRGPVWWRACLKPVPASEFKVVQVYEGSEREGYLWVPR